MGISDLLAEFLKPYADLVPRLSERALSNQFTVVDAFLFGPHLAKSRPVFHIPSADHIEYWPIHDQPLDPAVQTLTTVDEVRVAVNPAISVQIYDPLLVREQWGTEDWIANVCMIVRSKLADLYTGHNWSHLRTMKDSKMLQALNEELEGSGVEIIRYCTEDRSEADVTRHYGFEVSVGAGE